MTYFLRKGLVPHSGVPRAAGGAFATRGNDTGIGHVGAGSFDGLFSEPDPEPLPLGAGAADILADASNNPAALRLDGLPMGSGAE